MHAAQGGGMIDAGALAARPLERDPRPARDCRPRGRAEMPGRPWRWKLRDVIGGDWLIFLGNCPDRRICPIP
jgi:hypothetical protein